MNGAMRCWRRSTRGHEIDVPAASDLAADVRRRLEQPAPRQLTWRRWRAAVPIVLALLGLLLATPRPPG